MSVNAINNYYGSTASAKTRKSEKTGNTASKTDKKNYSTSASKTGTFDSTAAVYEKTSATKKDSVTQKKDHAAIVAQMKADTEKRTQQLTDLVQQMISQQGKKLGQSDSIWAFLAGGDFTVSPEVKAQAQPKRGARIFHLFPRIRIKRSKRNSTSGKTSPRHRRKNKNRQSQNRNAGMYSSNYTSLHSFCYDCILFYKNRCNV